MNGTTSPSFGAEYLEQVGGERFGCACNDLIEPHESLTDILLDLGYYYNYR